MVSPTDSMYANITLNDVHLAEVFYPILIDLAKHKHRLTYGELVERAKEENPSDDNVKNAIPVAVGRKLDVIRIYTNENDLPDLTCLIISKAMGKPSDGHVGDADRQFKEACEKDWSNVSTEFKWFVSETTKKITPRKKRKEPEARSLMSEYYYQHKAQLPKDIQEVRDLIIELLMEGFSAQEAYELVKKA